MARKTKIQKTTQALSRTAAHAGFVLMATAATLGVAELPVDHEKRAVLPMQPAFASVHEAGDHPAGSNELRRERDEVHPHYISYSINQRTPGRTGRA